MPYELVPLLLSLVLTVRYVLGNEASRRAKAVAVGVVGASMVVWWQYPQWTAWATVLQAAACIVMLTHLKVRAGGGPAATR